MSPEFFSAIVTHIANESRSLNWALDYAHSRGLRCTITTGAQDGGPPQIGVLVLGPVVPAADEGWDDRR